MKHALSVLTLLLCLAVLPGVVVAGIQVEMKEEATLSGQFVSIRDVATITGESPAQVARARRIFCGQVPEEDAFRLVSRFYLKMRLVQSGFRAREITWSGAKGTWVRTSVAPKIPNAPAVSIQTGSAGRTLAVEPTPIPRRTPVALDRKKKIVHAATKYIRDTLKGHPTSLDVKFDRFFTNLSKLRDGHMKTTGIEEYGATSLTGTAKFYVKVVIDDGPEQKVLLAMDVRPYVDAVVAVKSLRRGHKVTLNDLQIERRTLMGRSPVLPATEIESVIGKTLVRTVAIREMIYPNALEAEKIVKAGALVTVYVRGNGFTLESKAKARSAGAMGDTIDVMNPESKSRKTFKAVVVGPNEVEISK